MSFPRNHKLITKAEYQQIFDHSSKVTQKYLLALFKPNEKTHARLGIIVGKRNTRQAVARNQIKRIVRESFRANQEKLKGFDVIIIARQQCDTQNKAKLREAIDKLWEKLIVTCPKHSSSR